MEYKKGHYLWHENCNSFEKKLMLSQAGVDILGYLVYYSSSHIFGGPQKVVLMDLGLIDKF